MIYKGVHSNSIRHQLEACPILQHTEKYGHGFNYKEKLAMKKKSQQGNKTQKG